MKYVKSFAAALFLIAALVTVGCSKSAVTQVPGALNPVDSAAYVAVSDAQKFITTFHDQVAASGNPTLISVYDAFVRAYNAAQALEKAYHTALAAGGVTDQQTAALQSAVSTMTAAQAQVTPAVTPAK